MKKKKLSLAALLLVSVVALSTGCGKKTESKNVDDVKSNSNVESNVTSNTNTDDNTVTPAERTTMTNKFYNLIGAKKTKDVIKGYIVEEGFNDFSKYLFNSDTKDFDKNSVAAILNTTATTTVTVDKTKLDKNIGGGVKYVDEKKGTVNAIKIDFLNKQYKNVFGKDMVESAYKGSTSKDDYYNCEIAYQRNVNMFVSVVGACGGAGYTSNVFYLDDVVKENGNIVVKVYAGTHVSSPEENSYYKDASSDETPRFTKNDVVEELSEKTKTQYTLYNFVFKKASDGNYYFDSVKKA